VADYEKLPGYAGVRARRVALDISGPAAIPRRNGEPVFNEPWESRIFGVAIVLCEQGSFEWEEFRERLITEIAAAEGRAALSKESRDDYYEHFVAALEHLLVDKGICASDEISRRVKLELERGPDHR
jgi:nitrile hydratase accessory protein